MAQILKLRPVLKNEEELEEERNNIFDLPRKNCEQMAPEILRLIKTKETSSRVFQHRLHILKRMLKRARYDNIDSEIIPRLLDFDRSDKIIPNGEVSKKIYMNVFHSRNIDLYGRLRRTLKHPPRKYLELKQLAEMKGIEYTQEMDESFLGVQTVTEEEEELLQRAKKVPKLTTEKWKIGKVDIEYAPVGFANNPSQPYHSAGNEYYYSYDGSWKNGKMDGYGIYLFADNTTYEGTFLKNRPHGEGKAFYKYGQEYIGDFKNGQFSGHGKYKAPEGLEYEGEYWNGLRHGKGKLKYPSGMIYEGEFENGKPHGKGKMKSKFTGWAWEGSFVNGGISGHGTIIRPPPQSARIIYYWAEKKEPLSLPQLINHYLKEEEEARLRVERASHEINAPLRGMLLRDYVNRIRTTYHDEKRKEKLKKIHEATEKVKEQKEALHEARMKALAGSMKALGLPVEGEEEEGESGKEEGEGDGEGAEDGEDGEADDEQQKEGDDKEEEESGGLV